MIFNKFKNFLFIFVVSACSSQQFSNNEPLIPENIKWSWPEKINTDTRAQNKILTLWSKDTITPELQYIEVTKKNISNVFTLNPEVWTKQYSKENRKNAIYNLLNAQLNQTSPNGLTASVCYNGNPLQIMREFFNSSIEVNDFNSSHNVWSNSTGTETHIDFITLEKAYTLTLKSCNAGGRGVADSGQSKKIDLTKPLKKSTIRKIAQQDNQPTDRFPLDVPLNSNGELTNGFTTIDRPSAESLKTIEKKNLPHFTGRFDFENAQKEHDKSDFPWRNKGFDIKTPEGAIKLALLMQKYAYEGMYEYNPKNFDDHFNAHKNEKRYWCNTPWLNVTTKGRDLIHGLTKEFPIAKSDVYPNIAKEGATSWGAAFFNATACKSYFNIFGTPSNSMQEPHWDASIYDDGFVSSKMLFSTASLDDFPLLKQSNRKKRPYKWNAHVSKNLFHKHRSIEEVYHVQMDISFKDKNIIGTNEELEYWGMITYYYDPTYKGPLEEYKKIIGTQFESVSDLKNLPYGLRNMRPAGIQFGLNEGESIIFPGSENNHAYAKPVLDENGEPLMKRGRPVIERISYPLDKTRLNGPADNSLSSCLSCHATAGAAHGEVALPPGLLTNSSFTNKEFKPLNFNMQIDLAIL